MLVDEEGDSSQRENRKYHHGGLSSATKLYEVVSGRRSV
jgi:hypothetical protein